MYPYDPLLNERRWMVNQDNKGFRLDQFAHHLLQHEIWQQEQDTSEKIVKPAADQNHTVFSTRPKKSPENMVSAGPKSFYYFMESLELIIAPNNVLNINNYGL